MPESFLHHHPEFDDLIRIVANKLTIEPMLVEKDYWIMHCLYSLQQSGFSFELKGGTSLSKGYGIINRFSEDIDIRIAPPSHLDVKTGRNQNKPAQCDTRKVFYDWLADTITIDGIDIIRRDEAFDDAKYRSGGVRLYYKQKAGSLDGIKDGILLEVGFDDVAPNQAIDISSWAYDHAATMIDVVDNRAKGIACYHLGYTLVEKLQTISTKYRKQQETGGFPVNFMRHYYDIYCLLQQSEVLAFIGTDDYKAHKVRRFRGGDNPIITENEAFLLRDASIYKDYEQAYQKTRGLYYKEQPAFSDIMKKIKDFDFAL